MTTHEATGGVPTLVQPSETGAGSGEFNSWSSKLFFGSQIVAGLALLLTQAGHVHGDANLLILLISLNVLAGMFPVVVYGETAISLGVVLTVAIIILFGVPGAVIEGPASAFPRVLRHRPDIKVLTNAARFVIVNALAAKSYLLLGPLAPSAPSFSVLLGALLASFVAFSVSLAFVLASASVRTGQPISSTWDKNIWIAPHYIGMGFLGFGLAIAYIGLGMWGIMAFLMPLALLRLAMKQYVNKTFQSVTKIEQQNVALTQANIKIVRVSDLLRHSYDDTLEALVNALDARDQETKGHSLRVCRYMMMMAAYLGVEPDSEDWETMRRGSLLHDVGKIGVSDTILLKPGHLTDDEWLFMRQHPEIGYNMLSQVEFLSGAAEIILAHHERWDGAGYPRNLHGPEIPFGARIFSVVDTFDSMTSDRPYRSALSPETAFNEIRSCSGSQFDPRIVEAFLDNSALWIDELQMRRAS